MSIGEDRSRDADIRLAKATAGDFFELLKPRVMSLAVFTAFVGMVMAPGTPHPAVALAAIVAIAMGAGGAGALNMWYDADIDAAMARTLRRPIPAGRVTRGEALCVGSALSVLSVAALGVLVNWLAAALLAFTIVFYVVIYSMWLKRRTPQNIVIGGAAGALPPMIGWAAATGSVGIESVVLFLIIFLWTPPHFWALALLRSADYARVGIPMLPNVAGPVSTRRQIFFYALLVALAGTLPWALGFAGGVYGIAATLLGAAFVLQAGNLLAAATEHEMRRAAKALFAYSILYLFAVFATLLVEAILARLLDSVL